MQASNMLICRSGEPMVCDRAASAPTCGIDEHRRIVDALLGAD